MFNKTKKSIFLAGNNGMVGSAITRVLKKNQMCNLSVVSKESLDLRNQEQVNNYFQVNNIDEVYKAAAKVGGIFEMILFQLNSYMIIS